MRTARITPIVAAALLAFTAHGFAASAYLSSSSRPNASKFLQKFPAAGSQLNNFEVDVYNETRKYEHSKKTSEKQRWDLAKSDVDNSTSAMLTDFSCALGASLTTSNAPHFATVVSRSHQDLSDAESGPKSFFHRARPYVGNSQDTCVARSTTTPNTSYPSGHASLGWMIGLELAQLAPSQSTAIIARARAFGESRVVCGMHWPSDIEAGRSTAAAIFGALQSNFSFRSDMRAAQSDITSVLAHPTPPDAKRCAIENAAAAKQPWND